MTAPATTESHARCRPAAARYSWVALLALALGCRQAPQITGSYELAGVNGRALPVQAGHVPGGTSQLVSGTLTLNPDSTYVHRQRFQVHQEDRDYPDSTLQTGTYTRRMSTLTFHAPGGNMSGQVAGSALQLSIGGWTYLFRKAGESKTP